MLGSYNDHTPTHYESGPRGTCWLYEIGVRIHPPAAWSSSSTFPAANRSESPASCPNSANESPGHKPEATELPTPHPRGSYRLPECSSDARHDLVKISRRLITDDLPEDLYLHLR
ncbi:hypothetical protein DTO280E4_1012 [Paecilomyces variotii]|nr:hypothetical protein DTO169E5_1632 [Paecilomyces variotii]KAJ9247220.1 hypothetical protein DTO207G8_8279 [Paecilomyces variotii]KAJ9348111.1 hypothetical protein DTO027B9_8572 [Paecilomyces variotii]KAJ9365357.1 hypothetical protein DTO280E4_1012 [Paecilomyces variotii]KAJ9392860.1 hypothetical protein DTO063F5_660 [Paecilomyces variotii]